MLRKEEKQLVYARAFVPEHLHNYVHAISGLQPFLISDYLCYYRNGHLLFVGYPLANKPVSLSVAYNTATSRFHPDSAAIIAPEIWLSPDQYQEDQSDMYYKLKLPLNAPDPKVSYMCRRASRELTVDRVDFGRSHLKLLKKFISEREWTNNQKKLFRRIPAYLKTSRQAVLLEAKRGKHLIAYIIMDLGTADYAFYMFNVRSKKQYVPGASDLLFQEMVKLAEKHQKQVLNLGLGVNSGVRRFKEKWGALAFCPYRSVVVGRPAASRFRKLQVWEMFLASATRNKKD